MDQPEQADADYINGPRETEIQDDAETASPIDATGDPDVDASLFLVSAAFADETAARAAYNDIKEAEKEELILVVDAAIVHRDSGDKLHIEEERDWPGRVGALLGGGIGAILGTIGGPLGLVAGGAAGAALGAAAAGGRDAGMSDEGLAGLANSLRPGGSQVIVAVAQMWHDTTMALLTRAGGDVTSVVLTDEMARNLHVGGQGE